jgi:hypothetical protein
MIVRKGAVIITGTLLVQTFGPVCSPHDAVCEALGEPWHIHHDLPTGTFPVTSDNAAMSNVSAGISEVKLAADIVLPKFKD